MPSDLKRIENQNGRKRTPQLLLLVAILLAGLMALSAQALPAAGDGASAAGAPLCRFGIAASEAEAHVVPVVNAGWFLKFNYPLWFGPLPQGGAEQVHLIKTFQVKSSSGDYLPDYTTSMPLDNKLARYLRTHPGGLWIIGNEVDRGPEAGEIIGGQGDMYPDMYAVAYHDVRAFIKANDPTARVAVSALVEVTPGRLQYLDRVWNAYRAKYGRDMIVDVWNMHLYALPEVQADGITPNSIANIANGTDPALGKRASGGDADLCALGDVYCTAEHDDMAVFAEQVLMMRRWMKDHGQQQKPLILSEFSILYGYAGPDRPFSVRDEYGQFFTPQRVSTFMTHAFDYLNEARDAELGYGLDDGRLVQQWLWFAAYSSWGSSSDLVEADLQTLTLMGETFRDYVAAEEPAHNLSVWRIPRTVATIGPDGTATALLDVPIRNGGNTLLDKPFHVTFYADAARTQEIDSFIVSPRLKGCALQAITVRGTWPGLEPGRHSYWVHIDSDDVIDEIPSGDGDNIAKGTVLVNTHRVLLPGVRG